MNPLAFLQKSCMNQCISFLKMKNQNDESLFGLISFFSVCFFNFYFTFRSLLFGLVYS